MQKTYLFPLQIGEPLANASKIYRYTDTVLFPSTGKAGDEVLPYFGKSNIYYRRLGKSAAIFYIYWSPG
jgi:hypothetical protein